MTTTFHPSLSPAPRPAAAPSRSRHATATVGIVGGGRLAQMLHRAAIGLGVHTTVLAADDTAPAALAGAEVVPGPPDDPEALAALARRSDVITLDHDRTPVARLEELVRAGHRVCPGPSAVRLSHDKVEARTTFFAHGLPVPAFTTIVAGDTAACRAFADVHGWPLVAKAPRGGDDRGVVVLRGPDDVRGARLGGSVWLIEPCLPLAAEVAVVVVRSRTGQTVTYDPVLTTRRGGACHELVMPAPLPGDLGARAVALAARAAEVVGAEGICAVEMFVTHGDRLLVSEVATRPHISGHATLDACRTSQFENHLRAILGWPLGDPSLLAPAVAMVNLLGPAEHGEVASRMPDVLRDPSASVHLYREEAGPGRTFGHVTVVGDDPTDVRRRARRASIALLDR